jgi:osomolarity two-component system, sensor histidine kinase SLN1
MINFAIFQGFLLYTHYMRENVSPALRSCNIQVLVNKGFLQQQAERRLYTLREQLKIQFRATQKAQVNERKAADSKRRLTS